MRPQKINHFLQGQGQLLQNSAASAGQPEKGLEVWYRSGWATNSPKVQLQLTLRPHKMEGAEELEPIGRIGEILKKITKTLKSDKNCFWGIYCTWEALGAWIQGLGPWILDPESWVRDPGSRVLDLGP